MQHAPDAQFARLEIEKAASELAAVRDEDSLHVRAGSGLGATYGIPQSIQGAVPSVVQMTLRQPLLDRGRPRRADAARETVRSSEFASESVAEESAYRAALLFLDFSLSTAEVGRLRRELESFERIEQMIADRVAEGIDVPLAVSRSRLDAARAVERLASSKDRTVLLESELKTVLGLGADVSLRPEGDPQDIGGLINGVAERMTDPSSGEHPDIAALDARIRAARSRAKGARTDVLPRLDLVGQYALLGRFNNYDEFFRRFQRHNWQAGVALEIPLFQGRGVAERVARARIEERELELRQSARRAAILLEGEKAEAALRQAERLSVLAQQELEFARERLDMLLAQFDEGVISLDELERARVLESTAWGGLIKSRYDMAKARLAVLNATGSIGHAFTD